MSSGFVESNNLKLYYETEGEGEPLILLNGGPGFPHDYLQELRALAPYAHLVFYDQRGTGKSDKTAPGGYTVDANVEDVEAVRHSLNLGTCRILGHSWGGMLAQVYALKYPGNISKLILADTFSSAADCNKTLARMRAGVPPETRAIYERCESAGLYKGRASYPAEYQTALDAAYEPVFISIPPPEYLTNSFAKIAYDIYRSMWGEETEFRITGTLASFNAEPRLHEIRVPTLVIVGASDMPSIPMAEKAARLIPNARLQVFEHSRHFPFIEEKDKFIRLVSAFLNS